VCWWDFVVWSIEASEALLRSEIGALPHALHFIAPDLLFERFTP